jgi:curved DNA-binding protein
MAVKFRDYYEVLGVPRTATADEIKRAYRKLARKHHPDLAPAHDRAKATETFKEINEANEVLSDPEKRSKYDALGANWKNGMDFTPPPGGDGPRGGEHWQDFGDFSDFFESIFGAGGPRGGGRGGRGGFRVTMPGMDVEAVLPVTLEELIQGGRRRITVAGRSIDVEIPLGARDGTVLRLAGQGEPGTEGAERGDLYLRLALEPAASARVIGDDVEMNLPLWSWQAVLGAEILFPTPDGQIKLKVPPSTPSGRRLRLRGRGLPRPGGGRGDLYAVVTIEVPDPPSAADREAYESLKRSSTAPPDRPARGS